MGVYFYPILTVYHASISFAIRNDKQNYRKNLCDMLFR